VIAFGAPARRKFPLEAGVFFLNHGSFGAAPHVVLRAAERWRREMEANPDRFMREVLPAALRGAAVRLAKTLKVDSDHLAFIENATSGANAVLRSLAFRRGEEILLTSHSYGAVRQAARYVSARTGARVVEARMPFPVSRDADLVEPIRERLSRRTRLVVLDHIASPTGVVFPVRRLAALARRAGARVLVDGAHAPGQLTLDIPSLGVDWYVGNCHKWLFAPRGCAFLWAKKGEVHPLSISHGYRKGFAAEFDWTGTRDFSPWLAVPAALDFLQAARPARVRQHNHALVTQAARMLANAWGEPLGGPAEMHANMMCIRLPREVGPALPFRARLLAKHRLVVALMEVDGTAWCRISAQIYNTASDYDRLRDAVLQEASRASRRSRG
jgi:isopenicillin-N epimerase